METITKGWLMGFVGLFIEVVFIVCTSPIHSPEAIEIYQGKTTLQITYKDSIPIDSVVVYKPEFRK